MSKLKNNEQRAKNAITLILIVMIVKAISIFSNYHQYRLLQSVSHGNKISIGAATNNDLIQQIISITYLIVFIISAITFIQWFRRAYFNLNIKVDSLENSDGWAAGCWFVPILSLFMPYLIMKELYDKTNSLLLKKFDTYIKRSTLFVGWWWTLWITVNIFGYVIVFSTKFGTESITSSIVTTFLSIIGAFVFIPLAIITIKVIKDYSLIEKMIYEISNDVME